MRYLFTVGLVIFTTQAFSQTTPTPSASQPAATTGQSVQTPPQAPTPMASPQAAGGQSPAKKILNTRLACREICDASFRRILIGQELADFNECTAAQLCIRRSPPVAEYFRFLNPFGDSHFYVWGGSRRNDDNGGT
jgi:hypothetical protein